ncbi:hypothetical protein GCM10027168_11480 [Streptomyces capparidis]
MRTHLRTTRLLMAAALAAGGLTAVAAPPAAAAPAAIQACYDNTVAYASDSLNEWPSSGWAVTTSSCSDINIKPTRAVDVQVCFRTTGVCNGWRTAHSWVWTVAASNVRDNTQYYLKFNAQSQGLVAH